MNKSIIVMGEYPQNCGLEKEPIEWIVLKEEEHRCLRRTPRTIYFY